MGELSGNGQALQLNPYVTQMEKLSESLKYVTHAFVKEEEEKECFDTNVEEIKRQIQEELCGNCYQLGACQAMHNEGMDAIIRRLFQEIDEYGVELSIKNKRALERQCIEFEKLKEMIQRYFWTIKNRHLWEERIFQSKQASLSLVEALVKGMEENTKEIDASTFQDERLEKKISRHLRRLGLRPLKIMLFVSNQGRFEVHVSAKAKVGSCVTTKDMADTISSTLGRRFLPEKTEPMVIQETYGTTIFVERAKFQVISGVAKRKKEESEISGDNFLIIDLPGGKKCAVLSDGMGSGNRAYHQSRTVLELAEILLESGVPPKQTLDIMNAVLITEVGEVEFTTLDMCVIDTYKGEVDILKAGAASTYIVGGKSCQSFDAASLPLGVITELEENQFMYDIKKDCYIVMVTDGVIEELEKEEREAFIKRVIRESKTRNPKEIAEEIMNQALQGQNGVAKDDMMVLVLGVWELQF